MFLRRLHESGSPTGQPQHTESATPNAPASYAPHFRIGYAWYPGINVNSGWMHNKVTMGEASVGALPWMHTPIDAPRFSVIPRRAVRMGVIDNAQHGYPAPGITPRIVMPEVRRV